MITRKLTPSLRSRQLEGEFDLLRVRRIKTEAPFCIPDLAQHHACRDADQGHLSPHVGARCLRGWCDEHDTQLGVAVLIQLPRFPVDDNARIFALNLQTLPGCKLTDVHSALLKNENANNLWR